MIDPLALDTYPNLDLDRALFIIDQLTGETHLYVEGEDTDCSYYISFLYRMRIINFGWDTTNRIDRLLIEAGIAYSENSGDPPELFSGYNTPIDEETWSKLWAELFYI